MANDYHADMQWLSENREIRYNPVLLFPTAKSIISLSFPYDSNQSINGSQTGISRYAQGADYHKVLKKILKKCIFDIQNEVLADFKARITVDSAPILEKYWAVNSGLGWQGKNGNLISPKYGSYFFLAELITNIEFTPDAPIGEYCGKCTRCLEACPTAAIVQEKIVDAGRCISYLTIENKQEQLPDFLFGKQSGWVFGCDICQEVCPWNRFSRLTQLESFNPRPYNLITDTINWKMINEGEFNLRFAGSAVRRAGYHHFMRNVNYLLENVSPDLNKHFVVFQNSYLQFRAAWKDPYQSPVSYIQELIQWSESISDTACEIWTNWPEYMEGLKKILHLLIKTETIIGTDFGFSKFLKGIGISFPDFLNWIAAFWDAEQTEVKSFYSEIDSEKILSFIWQLSIFLADKTTFRLDQIVSILPFLSLKINTNEILKQISLIVKQQGPVGKIPSLTNENPMLILFRKKG